MSTKHCTNSKNICEVHTSEEEWCSVPGYEYYEISNKGRVRSIDRFVKRRGRWGNRILHLKSKMLKPWSAGGNGRRQGKHLLVGLYKETKNDSVLLYESLHRLVLLAFVGPCPEGMECCHAPDRNPSHNCVENLRWDTRIGNVMDRERDGNNLRGEENGMAKLKESDVHVIRRLLKEHNGLYGSLSLIARMYKVHAGTIRAIQERHSWGWLETELVS